VGRVQLQFHAHPQEALDLAFQAAAKYELRVALEEFFPRYHASSPAPGNARSAADELDQLDRIALATRGFDVTASSSLEFMTLNPGCLVILLGRLDTAGLRESVLSAWTEDEHDLALWRKIVKEARASMHDGATVVNPHLGATEPAPRHPHTSGAHRMARAGVKMPALAGWNEFVFDDLSAAS
jgi:hypothetical protein